MMRGLSAISDAAFDMLIPSYDNVLNELEVRKEAWDDAERKAIKEDESKQEDDEEVEMEEVKTNPYKTLIGQLLGWLHQLPVIGFNSGKYDLNVIKQFFIPYLLKPAKQEDNDDGNDEDEEEDDDDDDETRFVIKRQTDEQVCVGNIEVGISFSWYHKFYWAPTVERCQRLVFYPATVFNTSQRRKGLVNSSPLTRLFVYECHIMKTHLFAVVVDGSDTSTRCGPFYTLHSFTRRWWCVKEAFHQVSSCRRYPSFCRLLYVFTSHDITSNLRSSRQRTLPQCDSTSSDQRGNRSEETTEQTSKSVPPLDTSAGKVGQCPTHLPRIVVVVIHLNSPELHRRK